MVVPGTQPITVKGTTVRTWTPPAFPRQVDRTPDGYIENSAQDGMSIRAYLLGRVLEGSAVLTAQLPGSTVNPAPDAEAQAQRLVDGAFLIVEKALDRLSEEGGF